MSYTSVLNYNAGFENGKTYFLTYKGTGIHQQMGTVVKHLKKVSASFFVVRESNKISGGYHYHALIKHKKKIPKRWFIKGVHMKLDEICKSEKKTIKIFFNTHLEEKLLEQLDENNVEQKLLHDLTKMKIQQSKISEKLSRNYQKTKKMDHIKRILRYMSKEKPNEPYQNIHYYLQIRGKSIDLSE